MPRSCGWLLFAALSVQACLHGTCALEGTGTVRYLDLEGGFYGILADDGARYRPVNLPETFASDGLRVRFCARPVEGRMSIFMWGTAVEIRDIEALSGAPSSPPQAAGPFRRGPSG